MNSTVPRPRTPDTPILKPQPAGPYPQRIAGLPAHTRGILIGATQQDVAAAQRWVYQEWRWMRGGVQDATTAASVAVALVNNAHQHTASGLPGGETILIMEHGPFITHLVVTDEGPRPGTIRPSYPELRPDRSGLRHVDQNSVYWDWDITADDRITVRVRLEVP